MRKLFFILFMVVILLFSSCRAVPHSYGEITAGDTWSSLFDAYWKKMNTNYIFWDVYDSEYGSWDGIYDYFMPRFEGLGKIGENEEEALRLFFDASKELDDGHYALTVFAKDGFLYMSSATYKVMKDLGYSDDEIFRYSIYDTTLDYRKFEECDFNAENIKNTFSAFGIELPEDAAVPLTTVSGRGPFAAFTYFRTYDPETMKGMTTGYGITDDGILYLGFSGFDFYSYFETRNEFTEDVTSFLSGLSKAIDDNPEGIIIDMRGNGGGYIVDLDILLPDFLEKRVAAEFAISRRKLGDNRLDYGPWLPLCVYSNERSSFDKSIPIAVLTNKGSVSAAEMTTFFFKALHDEYGYDVTVVGGTTLGGHGSLVSNENELNGGSFNLSSHMVSSYTPSTEIRYIDGISREGNGIEPDVSVPFDYDEYINRKNDIRFNMALKIIREKL